MNNSFLRTAMLVGENGLERLQSAHVAVFGIGGVGGAACEALVRAGVGNISIFDDDTVAQSNINRQLLALHSTLGLPKTEVLQARMKDINPHCTIQVHQVFYTPQNANDYPFDGYDYVVDAVDTVSAKLEIIARAKAAGVRVISAMGAGNKLHPEMFRVADISKTSVCPLARVMRRELKKRSIKGVKVVYSTEPPRLPACIMADEQENCGEGRPGVPKTQAVGSISFVPPAAGLVLAGEVVRDLLAL